MTIFIFIVPKFTIVEPKFLFFLPSGYIIIYMTSMESEEKKQIKIKNIRYYSHVTLLLYVGIQFTVHN